MSSYNKAILVGRLTRDPELRYTGSGRAVATFGLAVDRFGSKASGTTEKETDFFDIVTWQQLAETVGKFATKGKMVLVEGRLQNRQYETKEGEKRRVTEIVASDVRFLSGGRRDDLEGLPQGGYEARPTQSRSIQHSPAASEFGAPASDFGDSAPARPSGEPRNTGLDDDLPF